MNFISVVAHDQFFRNILIDNENVMTLSKLQSSFIDNMTLSKLQSSFYENHDKFIQ